MITREDLENKISYLLDTIEPKFTFFDFYTKDGKEAIHKEYESLKIKVIDKNLVIISKEEYFDLAIFRSLLIPIYIYHILNQTFLSAKKDSKILDIAFRDAVQNYLKNRGYLNDELTKKLYDKYQLIIEMVKDKDTEHLFRMLSTIHIQESMPRLNKDLKNNCKNADLESVIFLISCFEVDFEHAQHEQIKAVIVDMTNKEDKTTN